MDYEKYMRLAIDAANTGINNNEQPYGAVLIADGKIVAICHNEVLSTNNRLNHAEIVALNKYRNNCDNRPQELILITTCEPCPQCFSTALKMGVNKFVYGSKLKTAISYGSNDLSLTTSDLQSVFSTLYDFEIIPGVLEDECDELFKRFYFRQNIVTYSSGTEEEKYWMNYALEIGKKGMLEKHELPIGVVLVSGDEILSESCTMTYTLNSPIAHGDFMSLYYAERKVYDPNLKRPLVMYSSLEPHLLGFGAAIKCHVDKVVFGLEAIPDGGSDYLPNMVGIKECLPIVVGGVMRDRQYELMKEFLSTHEENRVGYSYAKKLVKLYEEDQRKEL